MRTSPRWWRNERITKDLAAAGPKAGKAGKGGQVPPLRQNPYHFFRVRVWIRGLRGPGLAMISQAAAPIGLNKSKRRGGPRCQERCRSQRIALIVSLLRLLQVWLIGSNLWQEALGFLAPSRSRPKHHGNEQYHLEARSDKCGCKINRHRPGFRHCLPVTGDRAGDVAESPRCTGDECSCGRFRSAGNPGSASSQRRRFSRE